MITEKEINISSRWGTSCNQLLTQPGRRGLAVFFPGSGYPVDAPLLYYLRQAALEEGLSCLSIDYGFYRAGIEFERSFLPTLVKECLEAISMTDIPSYIVAKSIGTVVAGEVCCQMSWFPKWLWLTPIPLTLPYIENFGGEILFGTEDRFFPQEIANTVGGNVTKFEGATHALTVPGNWRMSLEVLERVTELGAVFFKGKE